MESLIAKAEGNPELIQKITKQSNVMKKDHPKEFTFGPKVNKFEAGKETSFKSEYLYMAFTSEDGNFSVEVTPKFIYEPGTFNDPNIVANKKLLKEKQETDEKDITDMAYDEKKVKIKSEIQNLLQDPFYNSKLIQRQQEAQKLLLKQKL